MRFFITGIPGSGKTTLARALAKKYHCRVFSDKSIARQHGLLEREGRDQVVNPNRLRPILQRHVNAHPNGIWEGHLLPETKITGIDHVWLLDLSTHPATLKKRLTKRGYPEWKILDNWWALKAHYFSSALKKNHPRQWTRLDATKPIKVLVASIMTQWPPKGRKA